jgi:glucokinase
VLTGEGEEYSHATEAGHMDFAPADDEQIALLNHLRKTYPHVSYERILSGPGLVNLYHFFAADGHETVTPAWVNEASEKGTDPAASKAMILYARIFGAFAGNIALSYRPQAGIYLTGGVAQKAARWLQGQDFTDAYIAKGRMRQVPEQTAVFLVTDELNGLNGILHHALNVAEKISRQHPTPLKKIYSTE